MIINIGNKCTECFKDTSFGSGRFVNRIPSGTDKYEGYLCSECQMIECDKCDKLSLEYIITDNGSIWCDDCNGVLI